jgi:hypothetical protein
MITTLQKHTGNNDNGLVGLPLDQRPGITLPTPANLDKIAADAAAKRNRAAAEVTPQEFGRHYGIPRDFAQFVQRLEARVIELEREVATLRSTSALPAHMRDVERRG